MASDLISRSALLDDMKAELEKASEENLTEDEAIVIMTSAIALKDFVTRQPTVDAAPVVHGEWIDLRQAYNDVPAVKCSACGKVHYGLETNYCPNCGADMRGNCNE